MTLQDKVTEMDHSIDIASVPVVAQGAHSLGDEVAAVTETPMEAAIDANNGLRHHGGRRPRPEDFADILTPAGDSGDIVGTDVDDSIFSVDSKGSAV